MGDLKRPVGNFRWVICALLFFATTINYIDRSTMSVMESMLRKDIGWNDDQYGLINALFMVAYAFGSLGAGWLMDKLGTRLGFAIALVFWSLAAAGHAFAHNVTQFACARIALGLGESGNFPGAIKTVAEWFPKKERALATGYFNSGSNIGAIVSPVIVPAIALGVSWQAAFIATGVAGLIWVVFWWPLYRRPSDHPRLSPEELAYIESDRAPVVANIPWARLLPYRQTWAFAIGKLLTDPVWWFFLFWFPPFMNERFGVDIKTIRWPMVAVYLFATVGSVAGGWMSSRLIHRGWSANAARKTSMFLCALCVVPVVAAPVVQNEWSAVLLVGLALAAHQGFSANLFTLTSDMFPRAAVGSVVGLGMFGSALASAGLQYNVGRIKAMSGSYLILFAMAGSAYLVALLVIQLFVPRIEPVDLASDGKQV